MKRMIFMNFFMLLGLYKFDPSMLDIQAATQVNNENLSSWLGQEMAVQAAVRDGDRKQEIIEYCEKNKNEKSIAAACLIAKRL